MEILIIDSTVRKRKEKLKSKERLADVEPADLNISSVGCEPPP